MSCAGVTLNNCGQTYGAISTPLIDGGPYTITQCFGCTTCSGEWGGCRGCGSFHAGIDIGTGGGAPVVRALGDAVVVQIGSPACPGCESGLCGGPHAVAVQDATHVYWYYHLGSHAVQVGQHVTRGTALGTVDSRGCSTGNHLHFQVQPGNFGEPDCAHALDPTPFLQTWPGGGGGTPCNAGYTWLAPCPDGQHPGGCCWPNLGPPPPPSGGHGLAAALLIASSAAMLAYGLRRGAGEHALQAIERRNHPRRREPWPPGHRPSPR